MVAVITVLLLGLGVAGALTRPGGLPAWAAPVAGAAIALALGSIEWDAAADAVRPLRDPLLFLLLVVPLAVLLDDLGLFEALARRFAGRYLCGGLWVLSALVVALLNLDAAVVLLTPLLIRIARRTGLDPLAMAFQPAIVASLGSSALPVSNLTNLVAVEARPLSTGSFLLALGPPTLVALGVGYWAWRLAFRHRGLVPTTTDLDGAAVDDRATLRLGALVGVVLLVGFTAGRSFGIEPWVVALVVDAALVLRTRKLPVRSVPLGTAALAGGLAVLAASVAAHVDLAGAIGSGDGPLGLLRITAAGALLANAANNLPAFLVGLPALPPGDAPVWAWLLGVNLGPTVLVTGSLAGLLWLDTARRSGLKVTAGTYFRTGVRVGLPALGAAALVLTVTARL